MSGWSKKTVLVTGGSGFLGSHLVRALADEGANIISVARRQLAIDKPSTSSGRVQSFQMDLLDSSSIATLCKDAQPSIDVLIHCAALDGNAAFKSLHPAEIVTNNVRLASNVLEAARLSGIDDVAMVSTAEIYALAIQNPVREADDFTKLFSYPGDGYVLSKVMIEMMGHVYGEQFGLRIYVPRPTNLYGPGEFSGTERGRVIPTMLGKILAGEEVEIWGDGTQSRTFINVEDAARAILLMVDSRRVGALNIATKESITIEELARRLFEFAGKPERIHFDTSKPVGHQGRILDVESLYEILNFAPRLLLKGLEETVSWYTNLGVERGRGPQGDRPRPD
jgi:dTDP-4-dehydro-6-deoxy-alpha-D-gulose 4-ketoreductase